MLGGAQAALKIKRGDGNGIFPQARAGGGIKKGESR